MKFNFYYVFWSKYYFTSQPDLQLEKYLKIKAINRSWDYDASTNDWNLIDKEHTLRPCTLEDFNRTEKTQEIFNNTVE